MLIYKWQIVTLSEYSYKLELNWNLWQEKTCKKQKNLIQKYMEKNYITNSQELIVNSIVNSKFD